MKHKEIFTEKLSRRSFLGAAAESAVLRREHGICRGLIADRGL